MGGGYNNDDDNKKMYFDYERSEYRRRLFSYYLNTF